MDRQFGSRIATDIEGWDAIDDHRTGTNGDRRTSEWLAACVRAAGVSVRIENFELSRWLPGRCAGGTTGPEGIAGELGLLTDSTAERGGAGIGLGSFGNNAGPDANERLARARRSSFGALVAVSNMDASVPGLALQNADRFTSPFGPPVLQVATEHEAWLRDAALRRATVRVTAQVTWEGALGSNVVCRVAGGDRTLDPLVVMTPKSAWWVCTAERAGGIAIWLALLRHFATAPPRRDILFIATSGHELGHLGLDAFLASNTVLRAHAWLHLGANIAAEGSQARLQASDADLLGAAQSAIADAGPPPPTHTPLGRRAVGEARNIHDLGQRYVSLLGSNRWFHHPDDRWPTTIDLDRTHRIAEAVLAIAHRLAL